MHVSDLITNEQRMVLAQARETYGDKAQILVANEELCELAAVCAKYPRYEDKERAKLDLHLKAVDEVSDVLIILDHVVNIFDLKEEEVRERIIGKVCRLENWLKKSSSMEQTTIDREVPIPSETEKDLCDSCIYRSSPKNLGPCKICGGTHSEYKKRMNCTKCSHYGNYSNLKPGHFCAVCVENGGNMFDPIGED